MSFFTTLFSTKKVIDAIPDTANKVVDGVTAGLDKMFFTDEEKSDASQHAMDSIYGFIKATMEESSIRSITRRVLAVLTMSGFLFLLIFGAIVYCISAEWAAFVLSCASTLSNLVLAVSVFYFGPYQVGGMITNIIESKKKDK
jgi:hypothetical protein